MTSATITPTSLALLEQHTWSSSLAPAMEPDEYVFILSSLQPHVDMARLCRRVQRVKSKDGGNLSTNAIVLALSCMNQYELRRACHEWRAIIVHIDPECAALQRSIATHYNRYHLWAAVQAVVWSGALVAVGIRQNNIIRSLHRWSMSRLTSSCVVALGCLFAASCAAKTSEFIRAIPRGYDVVRVKNDEAGTDHLFLVRRDYAVRGDLRIVPMYLLSGLGLGTMLLGARIAFKVRKAI